MHHQPDGAAFDIVLLLHVACVVVGLVTTATAAATATRLRRLLGSPLPLPEPLRRYFRPGVNWAGRTVYGIPVFGFALVAMSQGAYALGQGWVLGGLALFAARRPRGRGGAVAGRAAAAGRPGALTGAEPRRRHDSMDRDATVDGAGCASRHWSCWWPGPCSWWRSPERNAERGPGGVPVLSVAVASPPCTAPVAQPQPRPPPTGGGSV